MPEGIFWLLMTGEIPTKAQVGASKCLLPAVFVYCLLILSLIMADVYLLLLICSFTVLAELLQVDNLSKEWVAHADLPQHVVQMLNNFPETLHPMSQFSAAITAMNSESKFAKAYAQGVPKADYWEVMLAGCFII